MPAERIPRYGAPEYSVIEQLGRLVEFWGFRHQMGRIWCALYYSRDPLAMDELARCLSISNALVSMTLAELVEWGVVHRARRGGERKIQYEAEIRPWPMITRVLERREFQEIDRLVGLLECLRKGTRGEGAVRLERAGRLLELARRGRKILEGALRVSRVRVGPLQSFSLGLAARFLAPRGKEAMSEVEVDPDLAGRELSFSPEELAVIDQLGNLIDLWGFGKNMGRVWCALYLAGTPLAAGGIQQALSISSGLASTTIHSLIDWGVVRKVWVPGERKTYFSAETEPWRMISRVLKEREYQRIVEAIETCEAALEAYGKATGPEEGFRRERTASLLSLFRLAKKLLDSVLDIPEVNLVPLERFSLRES